MSYPIALVLPYMAGIVDGEGCITISRRGQPILRLSMYAKEPLDIISAIFGGNVTLMNRKDRKPIWQLTYTSQSAIDVATILEPYLVVKKAEAQLVIGYYQNFASYKGGNHTKIPQEEWDKRMYYYDRMQELLNRYRRIK